MCNDFLGWLCIADASKPDNLVVRTLDPRRSGIKENKLTIPVTQHTEEPPLVVYTDIGETSRVSLKTCSLSGSPPITPTSSLGGSTPDPDSDSEDYSSETDLPEVPGFTLKKRRTYSI